MSDAGDDKRLGMDRDISRRDFLNGVAVGVGASLAGGALPDRLVTALHAEQATQASEGGAYYPPTRTGMRGSHDGSFENAHALRDGRFWATASPVDTRESYDLVVVGAGISGLAAAHFFRAHAGPSARVLLLDNHDDFGGHAKRNEFHMGGRMLLMNGGTLGIDSPTPYSRTADGLLRELGVDPPALSKRFGAHATAVTNADLRSAYFFDAETFGSDRLVAGVPEGRGRGRGATSDAHGAWQAFAARTPLSPEAQRDWLRVQLDEPTDYMPGLSEADKKDRLSRMSYREYLAAFAKVHPDVLKLYQRRTEGEWGVGIDAEPALDCWAMGYPGFAGLGLGPRVAWRRMSYTAAGYATGGSYRFHYPDGNASIARLLVRSLVPRAMPGHTAEDIVTAVADYGALDAADSPVRIRLNSTAVRVRHVGPPATATEVEVTYARGSDVQTVHAKGVVLACWNMMIPYLCPELPDEQKQALHYLVKVPLVYTSVALRNWQAFHRLGVSTIASPGMWHSNIGLSTGGPAMGEYRAASGSPDDPILVHLTRTPNKPGLASAREQHKAGRIELLRTPFSEFERRIRDQFARVLAGGGFDPARDIEAITVNRWPHGYGYEYNPLYDPEWPAGEAPHEIGRRRFGRVTIANSDSGATAYTDVAIDQGYRAVEDLLTMGTSSHPLAEFAS
jgi:spermidine dehydrogenase